MRTAKFRNIIELNRMYIAVEDKESDAAERDRLISSMRDESKKQLEDAELVRRQMQEHHE